MSPQLDQTKLISVTTPWFKHPYLILIFVLAVNLATVIVFEGGTSLPAVGRLLSPSEGVWRSQNAGLDDLAINGLKARVQIDFDEAGIPHIFAQNNHDLYFAQGYLMAYHRLWQMDMTTRVGAGRLSEVLGDRALPVDRFFVRLGIRQAVQSAVQAMKADPQTWAAAQSFVAGVNAYIDSLDYRHLPPEYKIVDVWPRRWREDRVADLLKIMTFRLAGRSYDLKLTELLQKIGAKKLNQIFPEFLPKSVSDTFVPSGGPLRKDLSWSLPPTPKWTHFPKYLQPFLTNGSNVWAVGPSLSKTGHSLLANDTHLGYQLPALWYESQLYSPDVNVYGASFPGAPGVILGFNRHTAWGVTNGTTDVVDWYSVQFKDENSLEYKSGKEWEKAEIIPEKIRVRGSDPVTMPVTRTQYGFLMARNHERGLTVKWTAQRPSNELKTVLELDQSRNYKACVASLRYWTAPIQNFVCADKDNVGIYHEGSIPIRSSGQGRIIEPASPKTDWKHFIPRDQLPHTDDPARGYVYSANQRPIGRHYPYYLGWDYEEPFRGKRIHKLLKSQLKFEAADFIQMQEDILNEQAAEVLPFLVRAVRRDDLSEKEKGILNALHKWDYLARARSFEQSVFQFWWNRIEKNLWNELKLKSKTYYPKKALTIAVLKNLENPGSEYRSWLKPFASVDELITKSFQEAVAQLHKKYGEPPSEWAWGRVQPTQFIHVTRFPGFGSKPMSIDGSAYALNANESHHGPAWRLVVELGDEPKAWSQFPGGISGNPMSPDYEKYLTSWANGKMRRVIFWANPEQAAGKAAQQWVWEPQ